MLALRAFDKIGKVAFQFLFCKSRRFFGFTSDFFLLCKSFFLFLPFHIGPGLRGQAFLPQFFFRRFLFRFGLGLLLCKYSCLFFAFGLSLQFRCFAFLSRFFLNSLLCDSGLFTFCSRRSFGGFSVFTSLFLNCQPLRFRFLALRFGLGAFFGENFLLPFSLFLGKAFTLHRFGL